MTIAQRNKELVLGALKSAQAGDVDKYLSAMHPDVQIHEPSYLPFAGLYKGHQGFHELKAQTKKIVDVSRMEIVSATADEERVVLLMRIPLRGSEERVLVTEHWRIENGLVVEVLVFWFEVPEFI